MASNFQRALYKLNFEHQLDLYDPDLANKPVSTSAGYQLCRDAKDLWLYDQDRWEYVINKFNTQAPGLRTQWVPKPRGDPTTTSFEPTSQTATLKNLFQQLLLQEKAQSVPQSTLPFSISEEEEMMLMATRDEPQATLQPTLLDNRNHNDPYSSSSDMVTQPESSWLDKFDRQEQNDESLLIKNPLIVYERDDEINLNRTDQVFPQARPYRHTDTVQQDTTQSPRKDSHVRKRYASSNETEKAPRRPKTLNDSLVNQSEPEESVFSFTKPRDSFISGTASHMLSCAPSVNTSRKSTPTEINESFVTTATSLSFNRQPSNGTLRVDTPFKPQTDPTDFSDKLQKYLHVFRQATPFDDSIQPYSEYASFSTSFEVQRVALHNSFDLVDVFKYLRSRNGSLKNVGGVIDHDSLWTTLAKYTSGKNGDLPPKTSDRAWKTSLLPRDDLQHTTISFSGIVSFGSSRKESLLDVKLNPISLDQSNRLKRKYGSDRVLVLGIPSLDTTALPDYLKSDSWEVRLAFIEWLTGSSHFLLGRGWRAFYIRGKPRTKSAEKPKYTWRVYFFAVDGYGFKNYVDINAPKRTPIEQMLDWFFCVSDNQDQPLLKLFSRLQLLVSDTVPTITFKPSQVIQQDDIRHQGVLMTDGCARISLKAAQEISKRLGLPLSIPSAFQARIAGAKGMWVIDTSLEPRNGSDIWLEMSPSQVKFECLLREKGLPDKDRLTFEVHDYSRPLRPAPINFQLLPILIDRNVDARVFTELLKNDLDTKVEEIKESMSEPQALRAWNQEQYPTAGPRSSMNGVRWEGGLPIPDEEAINALVEAGFMPATCPFLWELCKDAVHVYCTRVEKRMNIYPGQATFAYMVPDFWGVLEEDQIHLGFSSAFQDKQSQWSDTLLHSIDVLVARLPAALPSDIHKVRAVFKPELAHLKDVVVFPTKGQFCLADKLSGGDYDGDRAWICWNETIVRPFKNFDTPSKKDYAHYGIQKDHTLVKQIWQPKNKQDKNSSVNQASQATNFIKQGFEFNMRRSLLGKCTNLHEAYCYNLVLQVSKDLSSKTGKRPHRRQGYSPMRDPIAMDLANLLGYLVDTAKNGYIFTTEDCREYLASVGIKSLPDPAYKIEGGKPSDHIIDQLVLQTAVSFRQDAMKKLDLIAEDSGCRARDYRDKDLLTMYKEEKTRAEDKKDLAMALVLRCLAHDVEEIHDYYMNILVTKQKSDQMSWSDVHEAIRRRFIDLRPASGVRNGLNLDDHSVIQRWHESIKQANLFNQQSWYLLAASALYNNTSRGTFPWKTCGKELMILKVLARNDSVPIIRQMHQYMKLDRRMWENAKLRGVNKDGAEYEDEIGNLDVDDFMGLDVEMMYESQAEAE